MFFSYLISLPIVAMRQSPSRESKVVSQALFAEQIQILKSSSDWTYIATPDGYLGWVEGGFVLRESPYRFDLEVGCLCAHVYGKPDTEFGPLFSLPFASKIQVVSSIDKRWLQIELPDGKMGYLQKGDVVKESCSFPDFAKKFLGLPYTWGGRSSFGFDCSGYVQMLYVRMGIRIPRDARQQIKDGGGEEVGFHELQLGDLIFWGKSAEEIRHVALFLEGEKFIHTSSRENKPYLRISKLSDPEWSGSQEAFYPFRSARRWRFLAGQNPEEKECGCTFRPDH